jgi:hypothetical protein
MILFRIVFAVTAILLTRDAFAEPGMWIGTAPFCSGSPADCTDLGMTYVKSDSKGGRWQMLDWNESVLFRLSRP